MSHPIPLHTADKLERALDTQFQCVAARGAKGWVMRIVAFFFCQYAEAVIELLEGLLAEYRAGTLVFPERAGDSSVTAPPPPPADRAAPSEPARAARRGRATPADHPCADHPRADHLRSNDACAMPAEAPEPSRAHRAVLAPRRAEPIPSSSCVHIRAPAFHPSAVPRWPIRESGFTAARPRTRISLLFPNKLRGGLIFNPPSRRLHHTIGKPAEAAKSRQMRRARG